MRARCRRRALRGRVHRQRESTASFVVATLRREAECVRCGKPLSKGQSACVGMTADRRATVVACTACQPPGETPQDVAAAATATAAATALVPAVPARGSTAVWVAVAVLGVGALVTSRTGRRVARTGWVGIKALAAAAWARARGEHAPGPRVVREAFEELGPTYIKLGQLIASSQGMFPEAYCQEFRSCLDRVPPFSYDGVHRTLREELGRDPEEVFAWIDTSPLASASIAQVHAARLRDGQEVVIKVQRPDIKKIVEADLRVLRLVAKGGAHVKHAHLANPVGIVEDFEASIREELDFGREAESMREFNRIMMGQGQSQVAAPRVVAELTTRRVLVMERFFGHRVDDVEQLRASGVDAEDRLLLGMRAWFQCLILHGFFHGDVHAGNLMALSDGRIGFLDFGIVGRFSPERRRQVTDYLLAFAVGDFDKLATTMVAMGSVDPTAIDMCALSADLREAYEPVLSNEASPAKYADIIPTILRTGVKHGMRLPRDFVLVAKQMLYFDRYAKLLAPRLNVFRDPRIVAALMEDVMRAAQMVPEAVRQEPVAGERRPPQAAALPSAAILAPWESFG